MHLTLFLSRVAVSQSQNLMSSLQLVVSSQIFLLSCLIHDFKHFSNYFFSIEASSSFSSAKLKPKIVFPAADCIKMHKRLSRQRSRRLNLAQLKFLTDFFLLFFLSFATRSENFFSPFTKLLTASGFIYPTRNFTLFYHNLFSSFFLPSSIELHINGTVRGRNQFKFR